MRELELCCCCDEPTGKAGQGEDSLYVDLPGFELGPFCDECYGNTQTISEYVYSVIAPKQSKLEAVRDASEEYRRDIEIYRNEETCLSASNMLVSQDKLDAALKAMEDNNGED